MDTLNTLEYITKEVSKTYNICSFSNLQSYIPPMKKLFTTNNKNIWFKTPFIIEKINIDISNNICNIIDISENIINPYLKVTHLLDPIHKLQGSYDKEAEQKKIEDHWNQAYVETIACITFGRLKDEGISPHFNSFYGAFTGIADSYSYNISDELDSYRKYRWFWDKQEKKEMSIEIRSENQELIDEINKKLLVKPEYYIENLDDDVEELKNMNCLKMDDTLSELESICISTVSSISTDNEDNDSEEDDSEEDDDCDVYIKVKNYPVMMIFTEKNVDTLDSLLEDFDAVGCKPNEENWENRWSAWIFQVIAGLCVIQKLYGATHNDLHTNNILWADTNEKYIYYTTKDSTINFRVPTYGKIFKIIDFGRAIFTIQNQMFISDDFKEGNDAATQYNFSPLVENPEDDIVPPNFSFDLARLCISLFESIFPTPPPVKKGAKILSKEKGRIVKETKSDLYNILWSWLIDDAGENILWLEDDSERFPDFELYIHIAKHCKNSIPSEQIYKKPFSKFIVDSIPKKVKSYYLYN